MCILFIVSDKMSPLCFQDSSSPPMVPTFRLPVSKWAVCLSRRRTPANLLFTMRIVNCPPKSRVSLYVFLRPAL